MSLILAIEPDHRRAAQLAELIRGRLNADLVHAHTTEGALTALAGIGDRVPDLVLVPSLLSAQEDAAIAGALRMIADAANVRMLTIPMLADPEQPPQQRGVFAKLRGRKTPKVPGGCDPAVFAEQIASYLAEAADRRAQEADADLLDPPAAAVASGGVMATPSDPEIPWTADAGATDVVAPPIEPVLEVPQPVFAPVVIAAPRRPVVAAEEHTSVILAGPAAMGESPALPSHAPAPNLVEEPPSIWLAAPAGPAVEPELEVVPIQAFADVVTGRDEPDAAIDEHADAVAEPPEPEPFASEPLERPAPVLVTEAPQIATEDFALEEVLQALALEDTPQVTATSDAPPTIAYAEPAPVFSPEEVAPVVTIEFPQDVSLDDTAPESIPEPPAAGARRRRNARPAVLEADETFDLDALLAPLLSEIAAKRAGPASAEPVQSAPAAQVPPAVAVPTVEPISPPLVTTIDHSEPIAVSHVDNVPEMASPLAEAALTVEPTLAEPTLAIAPALDETALAAAAALAEPTLALAPALDETALAAAAALAEPTLAVPPALDETALAAAAALAEPILAAAPALDEPALVVGSPLAEQTQTLAVEPTAVEPILAVESPIAEPALAVEPPIAEPRLATAPPIAEPILQVQSTPTDWTFTAPTLAAQTDVDTPVEPRLTVATAAAETDIDPMFFADNVHDGTADPAPHDRPAWVELIESLRKDIERLKAERAQPAEAAPPTPVTTQVARPQAPRIGRVLSIAAARPASPTAASPAERVRTASPRKAPKPIQDQWGLFDPEQCGFAALRAKLDEISAREEVSV